MVKLFAFGLLLGVLIGDAQAGSIQAEKLQTDIANLVTGFDGRVGVCVQEGSAVASINGDQRFSIQSVMKLVAGMAVLDDVDHNGWHLDDPILVRREDLSLSVEPIAQLVTADGYKTTIGDLIERAIDDSDSAAVDILLKKLGGPANVQAFLDRRGIANVRIDRDEKHLQTETVGLSWRPEFVDPAVLQRATDAVPDDQRDAAYRNYQTDPRDTATPTGMASLLQTLATGTLLSKPSTNFLLDVMCRNRTGSDRLRAGVPHDWKLADKTGTSGSWKGVTAATNDVGILTAPDGSRICVVVFIADTRASYKERAALMASIARAVVGNYRN
jgi:beta-lactamase class A